MTCPRTRSLSSTTGKTGNPGINPESEDEEEVVPLDELASFVADMMAFATEDVEQANVVSVWILRDCLRSLRC